MMKIAIILHGNLRTFFMPLRENNSMRICDIILSNIVEHNNGDVFLVTDTTDFYYDGVQFFDEVERDKVLANKTKSFDIGHWNVIDFINSDSAKTLLKDALNSLFGTRIKTIEIHDVIDVTSDPKYILLSIGGGKRGCTPDRIVNQYVKVKRGGELLKEYERKNNICYDFVFSGRLDNKYCDMPLSIKNYDYDNFDMFVPGLVENLFIYDWASFGNKRAMDLVINLYNELGYTFQNRLYRCECVSCKSVLCGIKIACRCGGKMIYDEMTLASEYHLYRILLDHGIRYATTNIGSPYRYRDHP